MTRETKIGMIVAGSFLSLVGVVVGTKLYKRDLPENKGPAQDCRSGRGYTRKKGQLPPADRRPRALPPAQGSQPAGFIDSRAPGPLPFVRAAELADDRSAAAAGPSRRPRCRREVAGDDRQARERPARARRQTPERRDPADRRQQGRRRSRQAAAGQRLRSLAAARPRIPDAASSGSDFAAGEGRRSGAGLEGNAAAAPAGGFDVPPPPAGVPPTPSGRQGLLRTMFRRRPRSETGPPQFHRRSPNTRFAAADRAGCGNLGSPPAPPGRRRQYGSAAADRARPRRIRPPRSPPPPIGSDECSAAAALRPDRRPVRTDPPPPPAPVTTVPPIVTPTPLTPPTSPSVVVGDEKRYVVQPGDTYASIAKKNYGDERYAAPLEELNRSRIGAAAVTLQPGTAIVIPTAASLQNSRFGGLMIAAAADCSSAARDDRRRLAAPSHAPRRIRRSRRLRLRSLRRSRSRPRRRIRRRRSPRLRPWSRRRRPWRVAIRYRSAP